VSTTNDPFDEMDESLWPESMRDPLHIDEGTVDRLLDGMPADDAPPSYRGVAELLSTLNAPASADELAGEDQATAKITKRYYPAPQWQPPAHLSSKGRRSGKRLRRSGAALVGTATLFIGLGAAGALPGAAQGVASDVLATIGVDAPNPGVHANDPADVRPASDVSDTSSTNSSDGADGNDATTTGTAGADATSGGDKSATGSSGASGDKSQGGQNGQPSSTGGDPQSGGSTKEPPGQSNAPNGGVGNGNGNGNAKHVDGTSATDPGVDAGNAPDPG
jgi:hypothetical protein